MRDTDRFPVEVGITGPLSGRSAHLGREMVQAARLAVDEVNARGRVHGAPVGAVVLDDAGRPETGVEVARAFAGRGGVVAVVGPYNSDVALRTAPVYHDAGLALVNPIVSNPALTGRGWENVFRLTNRDDRTAHALAVELREGLGKSRAVVVRTATTYGESMTEQFVRAFAATGGRVVARYTVTEGERNVDALVERLPRDVDVVFYGGTFEGAPIVTALRRAGRDLLFATGDGCWDRHAFLQPAAEAAARGEGTLVLAASPDVGQVPGSAAFARDYERTYGPIGNYAVNAYDATRLVLAAVAASGRADRAGTLAAIRDIEYRGIGYAEPTRWDTNGDNLATGTFLKVVEDGRFRQVAAFDRAGARTAGR
ncbi:branched-chain amino acid ABC transporter substrate-binding protein [Micromonospora sp. NPDC049559]|uniref:branched-chain amino acid ABC transporter substrate-binding protein n=1 Tax=Micromonospora sp. NPDC049559 TaxID=3155923 RepID=UPI00343F059A